MKPHEQKKSLKNKPENTKNLAAQNVGLKVTKKSFKKNSKKTKKTVEPNGQLKDEVQQKKSFDNEYKLNEDFDYILRPEKQ